MHYYKRNIGDYAKKAGRLSMLEHGAYNLLLDACYDREEFPTRDQAIEWTWASNQQEIDAVDFVLSRFFEKQEDGIFIQSRVLQELEHYTGFCEVQAQKGKKGGRPKKATGLTEEPGGLSGKPNGNPNGTRTEPETTLTTNHKPLTTNQTPLNPPKGEPDGFADFWQAYPRKTGKGNAIKWWKKRKPSKETQRKIMDGIKRYQQSDQWNKDGGRFIPHPTTWLNGGCWEDDPNSVGQSGSGGFVC